jgi:hypothetical protein
MTPTFLFTCQGQPACHRVLRITPEARRVLGKLAYFHDGAVLKAWNSAALLLPCPCGGTLIGRRITGSVTDTPCKDACRSATRPQCACSCGGANHGAHYAA